MAMNDTPKEYLEAMLLGIILVRAEPKSAFDRALDEHFRTLERVATEKWNGNKRMAVQQEKQLTETWSVVQRERFHVMRTMLIDKFGDEGNKVMNAFMSGAYDEEFSKIYGGE